MLQSLSSAIDSKSGNDVGSIQVSSESSVSSIDIDDDEKALNDIVDDTNPVLLDNIPSTPLKICLSVGVGKISIAFHERDNIPLMKANDVVKVVKSNFYQDVHSSFDYRPKQRTKKWKKKNTSNGCERKITGTGTCMNSSISFMILTETNKCKYYDIRIYRNGIYQIPGIVTENYDDAIDKFNLLVEYLGQYFSEVKHIEPLRIIMKNYRFVAREGYRINFDLLFKLLNKSKSNQEHFVTSYITGSPMMYVKFKTPTEKKVDKMITVSISTNGKINIQGGIADPKYVNEIYSYLIYIFRHEFLYMRAPEPDILPRNCKKWYRKNKENILAERLHMEKINRLDNMINYWRNESNKLCID